MQRRITRAALRFYGGKWKLASWIIRHFPAHHGYVEPFGGAMSVLLQKAPSLAEVYNDADQQVVTFFRVLREQPDALIRQIALTPFSRAEVDLACQPHDGTLPDLECARRLYVRAWQSIHGAPAAGHMGWRYELGARGKQHNLRTWLTAPDTLAPIAERLRSVQLECDDAFTVLRRFDRADTLFYVDPPYLASTRGERWATTAYNHELTDAEHVTLADHLHRLDGLVVLSGYDSELYADLYCGWRKVQAPATTQAHGAATECLWLSPSISRAQPHLILEGVHAA